MRISRSLSGFLRRSHEEVEVEPETEPGLAGEPAVAAEPQPERRPEPEREQTPVIELAPPPPPEPEPELEPPVVVPLVLRDPTPRIWNLWELERIAKASGGDGLGEERTLLLLHLRQFADASGDLPVEFDPLIRDTFGADLAVLAW